MSTKSSKKIGTSNKAAKAAADNDSDEGVEIEIIRPLQVCSSINKAVMYETTEPRPFILACEKKDSAMTSTCHGTSANTAKPFFVFYIFKRFEDFAKTRISYPYSHELLRDHVNLGTDPSSVRGRLMFDFDIKTSTSLANGIVPKDFNEIVESIILKTIKKIIVKDSIDIDLVQFVWLSPTKSSKFFSRHLVCKNICFTNWMSMSVLFYDQLARIWDSTDKCKFVKAVDILDYQPLRLNAQMRMHGSKKIEMQDNCLKIHESCLKKFSFTDTLIGLYTDEIIADEQMVDGSCFKSEFARVVCCTVGLRGRGSMSELARLHNAKFSEGQVRYEQRVGSVSASFSQGVGSTSAPFAKRVGEKSKLLTGTVASKMALPTNNKTNLKFHKNDPAYCKSISTILFGKPKPMDLVTWNKDAKQNKNYCYHERVYKEAFDLLELIHPDKYDERECLQNMVILDRKPGTSCFCHVCNEEHSHENVYLKIFEHQDKGQERDKDLTYKVFYYCRHEKLLRICLGLVVLSYENSSVSEAEESDSASDSDKSEDDESEQESESEYDDCERQYSVNKYPARRLAVDKIKNVGQNELSKQ